MRNRRFPLSAVLGVVLMFIAFFGIFVGINGFMKKTTIMVANGNLAAFVDARSHLRFQAVPTASVTSNDITAAEYDSSYKSQPVLPLVPVLDGQRLDKRIVAVSPLSFVLPDERVIGVTASLAQAAGGNIRSGSVVDVQGANNGLSSASGSQFDKVLCVSQNPADCSTLVPGSTFKSSKSGGGLVSGGGSSSGPTVYLALAVPTADALTLGGEQVSLSLDPFCAVDRNGYFVSVQPNRPCAAPQGRQASSPPANETQQTTTTTTPTTTTSGR